MKVMDLIQVHYADLSRKEKEIAQALQEEKIQKIIKNGNISDMSLAQFSTLSKAGQASVLRFIRKLGFESFTDFKFQLWSDEYSSDHKNVFDDSTGAKETLEKFLQDPQIYGAYEEAARIMDRTDQIFFYGYGSSNITARAAQYYFFRSGLNAQYLEDAHMVNMHAALGGRKDVFFFISNSGENSAVLQGMKAVREKKRKSILLTQEKDSQAAQMADCVILTPPYENLAQHLSFMQMIMQLTSLEALYEALYKLDPARLMESQARTSASVVGENGYFSKAL